MGRKKGPGQVTIQLRERPPGNGKKNMLGGKILDLVD
jgi:hypothetical protein